MEAPHNVGQVHELRRVATLLDMLRGTHRARPRSRDAIVEVLARTALGLKKVIKAEEGFPRKQAFRWLTAAASPDGVETEAPPHL